MPAVQRISMITAAALCVAVSAVHIGDQGGFAAPDWLGWAYRLLEVGSVAVAFALLFAAGAGWQDLRTKLVWVAAALVGVGPFLGYVFTRTTGLPGATDDIGNWGEPLGVASLLIEGVLIAIAAGGLLVRHRPSPVPHTERARVLAA